MQLFWTRIGIVTAQLFTAMLLLTSCGSNDGGNRDDAERAIDNAAGTDADLAFSDRSEIELQVRTLGGSRCFYISDRDFTFRDQRTAYVGPEDHKVKYKHYVLTLLVEPEPC